MNDEVVEKVIESNTSKEIGELVKALAKVQGSINPAKRDSDVEYILKSGKRIERTYADLTSVWDCCRKELSQNALAVIQTTKSNNSAVTVLTTLAHESGQWIRGELTLYPGGNDPQSYGSALTYARRYSLAAIVGIATGEDDDAENATRGNKKEKVKTTYVGNRAEEKEKAAVDKIGEKEVKDEPGVLSEKDAQKEQAELLNKGKPAKPGRNQLNIKWHILKNKLVEINFFGDDASYRDWLKLSFKAKSSKDLSDEQMNEGIALMAKIFNKGEKK